MEISLTHGPNPSRTAEAFGIPVRGPYLEDCWLPVAGPSTVLLTRLAHHLAVDGGGRAVVPAEELAGMLGLGRAEASSETSQLGRTLKRSSQFGLGQWDRDRRVFRAFDHVLPVPNRRLNLLTTRNLWRHAHEMSAAAERLSGRPGAVHEAHQRSNAAQRAVLAGERTGAALDALERLTHTGAATPPPSAAL